MKYNDFKFLFPPRPEHAVATALLKFYERRGWLAQFKKNGTNSPVWISPKKEIISMTRHNEQHKAWKMTEHLKEELAQLFPEKKWFMLCAELLHNKNATVKNTLYIYDVLVWKGEFLFDTTFLERQQILDERLITNVEAQSHYVCDSGGKIWYAKRFNKDFKALFLSIRDPKLDEGLVLKDPEGRLRSCRSATDNSSWQVKCRHPGKHYQF